MATVRPFLKLLELQESLYGDSCLPNKSQQGDFRWDEKAGLRRDALSSQVIDALEGARDKETGHEEA
jgi:hypothetical protein